MLKSGGGFMSALRLGTVLATGFLLGCVIYGCSPVRSAKAASLKPDGERHAAPDFALKDADGKTGNPDPPRRLDRCLGLPKRSVGFVYGPWQFRCRPDREQEKYLHTGNGIVPAYPRSF